MNLKDFRMPAEWEEHSKTWLSWPHQEADWPGKFEPVPWVFAEIARLITASEKLGLIVKDAAAKKQATDYLKRTNVDLNKVEFHIEPTDRGWMRDCGAIFIKNKFGDLAALDFEFNAWAKYPNYKSDNKLATAIAKSQKAKLVKPMHKNKPVVLEGGAIDVSGAGDLITTEECLLSKRQCRNPGFTKEDYEAVFKEYLGVENTIWLGNGIQGDDTHGHVDDLARFVNKHTIVTVVESNRKSSNYDALKDNLKRLKKAEDKRGRKFEVVELPMPKPVIFDGEVLPASYANFLITNKSVLVPIFNDAEDKNALSILGMCFPKHEVVGIYSRDLVWGLGTIHCLTQQVPSF